jgi:hypothetical protein
MVSSVLTSPPPVQLSDYSATASSLMVAADPLLACHEVEQHVWSGLQTIPGVHFSTLVVHRMRNGFCIDGVMDDDGEQTPFDVCRLVRALAPGHSVVNRIVVLQPGRSSPNLPR